MVGKNENKNGNENELDDLLGQSTTAVAESDEKPEVITEDVNFDQGPESNKVDDTSEEIVGNQVAETVVKVDPMLENYIPVMFPCDDLTIHLSNPRQDEPGEDDIKDMVKRIKATGGRIVNPIHITSDGGILAGRRRAYAYDVMKKKTIPAIVWQDHKKFNASTFGLVEQDATKALTPIEMGKAIQRAIESGDFKDESEAAKKIGVSASTVNRLMTLLNSGSDELIAAVETGMLSPTAATKIAKLGESDQAVSLAAVAALEDGKATVKNIEKIVKDNKPEETTTSTTSTNSRGRKKTREMVDEGMLPTNTFIQLVVLDPAKEDGDNFAVEVTFAFRTENKTFGGKKGADVQAEIKSVYEAFVDNITKIQKGLETARKALVE